MDEKALPAETLSKADDATALNETASDVTAADVMAADKSAVDARSREDRRVLIAIGFDPSMVMNALMTRNREDAVAYLCGASLKSALPIWQPPLQVRVGSWLPNLVDGASGKEYTAYFISVTHAPSGSSWQLYKRYASIHDLYQSTKTDVARSFPRGLKNRFPSSRIGTFMLGLSDTTRERRGKEIDDWFREVLSNQRLMLNTSTIRKFYDFFELSFL